MSDLITLVTPDMEPISASSELANTWGTGDSLDSQINTFKRNNPQAAEKAAELGMDIEEYYLSEILGLNGGSSQQNFFQKAGSLISKFAMNKVGDVADVGKAAFSAGKNIVKGKPRAALDDAKNVANKVNKLTNLGTSDIAKEMFGDVAGKIADAEDATVMKSAAAGGFLRDDITGKGTFLGGANTLMEDDETINYNTNTGSTESTQTAGNSDLEKKYNAYLEMVQRMSGKGIESRSQSLEQARGTFGPQLFGAAEDYRTAAMDSFARTAGLETGASYQEVLSAFTQNDPTEEKRLRDESRAVGVASGRSFDPAAMKGTMDLNQLFQARKTPYIQSMLPELTLGRGMQYAGGLDATVMDTLPSFADQVKFDTAQQQNQFNQDLLEAQRKAGDSNKIAQGANAFLGAYQQDLFGLKSNVVDPFAKFSANLVSDTLKGLFPGNSGSKNNFDYSEYQSQYGFPGEEEMSRFLENDGSYFNSKLEDFKY